MMMIRSDDDAKKQNAVRELGKALTNQGYPRHSDFPALDCLSPIFFSFISTDCNLIARLTQEAPSAPQQHEHHAPTSDSDPRFEPGLIVRAGVMDAYAPGSVTEVLTIPRNTLSCLSLCLCRWPGALSIQWHRRD